MSWQCAGCDEQHEDRFAICWKCGCDRDGNEDPEFEVSDSVEPIDQAPVGTSDRKEFSVLELPTISYFSIPFLLVVSLVLFYQRIQRGFLGSGDPMAPTSGEVLVHAVAFFLVVIPASLIAFKDLCDAIRQRNRVGPSYFDTMRPLTMFRLPDAFCSSYPWFVPIYYSSITLTFVAPIGVGLWIVWSVGDK